MAYNPRFSRREGTSKNIQCSCGGQAKLTRRRNFPHGRKSKGVSRIFYKCTMCHKETQLNRQQEAKK